MERRSGHCPGRRSVCEEGRKFDEAGSAQAVIDSTGAVVEWGEGAQRLLGHTAPDVVGRPAERLLAPGSKIVLPESAADRWSGGLTLRHRDGHEVSVWLLADRSRPESGDRVEWRVICPLGDRGPLPSDDLLPAALLEQSPCPMAIYDNRLRLHRINEAMERVIGLPEERIRGLRLTEIGGNGRARNSSGICAGRSAPGNSRTWTSTYVRAGRSTHTRGRRSSRR